MTLSTMLLASRYPSVPPRPEIQTGPSMKPNPAATVFSFASGAIRTSSAGSDRVMLNGRGVGSVGADCAFARGSPNPIINEANAADLEIIELKRDFLAGQAAKRLLLRFEAPARVRLRERRIERAIELIRADVVARFAHGRAECL